MQRLDLSSLTAAELEAIVAKHDEAKAARKAARQAKLEAARANRPRGYKAKSAGSNRGRRSARPASAR